MLRELERARIVARERRNRRCRRRGWVLQEARAYRFTRSIGVSRRRILVGWLYHITLLTYDRVGFVPAGVLALGVVVVGRFRRAFSEARYMHEEPLPARARRYRYCAPDHSWHFTKRRRIDVVYARGAHIGPTIAGWKNGRPVPAISGGDQSTSGIFVAGTNLETPPTTATALAVWKAFTTLAATVDLTWNDTTNQLLIAGFAALTSATISTYLPYVDFVNQLGGDPTGAADQTTKFNTDVNALTHGCVVWFRAGSYKINTGGTTCTLSKHVRLLGANRTDVDFVTAHATVDMFTLNEWFIGFETVGFDSSVTRTAGYAVNMPDGMQYSYIRECQIDDLWSGIRVQNHLSYIDDIECRNMGDKQTGGVGAANGQVIQRDASASSAHDVFFRRITSDNSVDPTGFGGIRVTQTASLVVSESNIINAGNALDLIPNANSQIPSCYSIQTFYDNSVNAVNIGGSATGTVRVQRVKFVNCGLASATGAGLLITQTNTQGVDIVNCDLALNAVGIDANTSATEVDWTVRSSRIAGNTTAGIRTLAFTGHKFVVDGNVLGNVSGFGANAVAFIIGAGTYNSIQISDNRGFETNTTIGYGNMSTTGFVPTVAATNGQMWVNNNIGATSATGTVPAAGVSFTTTELILAQMRVPGNSVRPGTTFAVKIVGTGPLAAGNYTHKIRVGPLGTATGDPAVSAPGASGGTVTGRWQYDAQVVMPTLTTCRAEGHQFTGTGLQSTVGAPPAATAVTTSADWFITVTGIMSASTCVAVAGSIQQVSF